MNEYSTQIANYTQVSNLKQMSDEEFWDLAQRIAHATPDTQAHSEEFLLCECGQVHILLSLTVLREIIPSPHQFTLLPDMPSWMLGLTAWRGEIIAVADLEAYLLDSTAINTTTNISKGVLLIAQGKNASLGFFVSTIGSTTTVERGEIHPLQPTSPWFSSSRIGAIKGIYEESLLLDVLFILTDVHTIT